MKNVEIRIGEGLTIIYDLDKVHLGTYEGKELRKEITEQFVRYELLRIIQGMLLTSFSIEGDVKEQENNLDYIMLEKYLNILLNNVKTTRYIKENLELGNLEIDFKHLYVDLAKKVERMCEKLGVDSSSQSNVENSLKRHTNLL